MYKHALKHHIAIEGFESDFNGMKWADVCVMVLPCVDLLIQRQDG